MKSNFVFLVASVWAVYRSDVNGFNINIRRRFQQKSLDVTPMTTSLQMIQQTEGKQSNGFFRKCISTIAAMSVFIGLSQQSVLAVSAVETDPVGSKVAVTTNSPKFYWGVGCFWHVQHEFVAAEKRILGRSENEITVRQLASSHHLLCN